MKNGQKIIKWHKFIGSAILAHLLIFMLNTLFLVIYFKEKNIIFLIITVIAFLLTILSYVCSLFTWNSIFYLDNEKFWIEKQGKIIEWKIDKITSCKISKCWYGRPRFYRIEIISSDNVEKLLFEYSADRERKILLMVRNTNAEKLFVDAFK